MSLVSLGNDSDPNVGSSNYGYGGGPATNITVTATNKNATIIPTVNVTPNSQVDTSTGVGGTSRNNTVSNITGDLAIFTSDPDILKNGNDFALNVIAGTVGTMGKLADNVQNNAFDLTGRAFDFATGAGASAFKLVNETTTDALKFAAGVTKGYADQFSELQAGANNITTDALKFARESDNANFELIARTVGQLGQSQMAALNFFGTETDKLQSATVNAIDTVALRTSSESAQGLDSLQKTFVKIAVGLGVVVVAVAFISRGGLRA